MSKYILWDLDGTLVESEEVSFKTAMFKHASNKINLTFQLEPDEFTGHEARSVFSTLLQRNKIVDVEKYLGLYNDWYEEAIRFIISNVGMIKPRENACDIWRECFERGFKQVVVTSSRKDVVTVYLENMNLLPTCELMICRGDVSEPKPSPIPYLTAMNKLKISTKECIVVEDSVTGITSAKKANIYTIAWVKDKNNPKYSIADFVTDKLDEDILIQKLVDVETRNH